MEFGLKQALIAVSLIAIFLLALSIRLQPAKYGELQALDPFYIYRISEYMVQHNLQLPEKDWMRHYPFGDTKFDYYLPFFLPASIYLLFGGFGMHYLHFAIIFPAVMGALACILIFFIGRELYDWKSGLLSALFASVIPAFIDRTSAGFFEKEPTAMPFLLAGILFFILAYKRQDWKWGIFSGICLGLTASAWGGFNFPFLLLASVTFLLLLLNRYSLGLLYAFAPAIILGVLIPELMPTGFASPDSFSFLVCYFVLFLLLARFSAERFGWVKKEKFPWLIPALILFLLLSTAFSMLFSDFVYQRYQSFTARWQSVEMSTVAESQPGNWDAIIAKTGTHYASAILPLGELNKIFSLWPLALLGLLLLFYRIYREREFFDFLYVIWFLSAVTGVYLEMRLIVFIGPPFALLSGYLLSWLWDRTEEYRKRKGWPIKNYLTGAVALFILLTITTNVANGWVYGGYQGPSICLTQLLSPGEPCLRIDENGTYHFAPGQPWYEAMQFLAEKTEPYSNVLSWWDFGYWFQTRGQRPSVTDGGGVGPRYTVALWFTDEPENWTGWEPWLKDKYGVDYILMDYTLPGKYGAISKIATRGKQIVSILQFYPTAIYPKDDKLISEFSLGPYKIWVPVNKSTGAVLGPAQLLISKGESFISASWINDVCSPNGIQRLGNKTPEFEGCISFASFGTFLIPPEAKNTIFTRLMFMDGYGLPVEKVFDNKLIKIYKVLE